MTQEQANAIAERKYQGIRPKERDPVWKWRQWDGLCTQRTAYAQCLMDMEPVLYMLKDARDHIYQQQFTRAMELQSSDVVAVDHARDYCDKYDTLLDKFDPE